DRALSRLDAEQRDIKKVAVLHYAPIKETVIGEPEAIYPFLGCSRLAEPLNRHRVMAAFHGHAHIGSMVGHTSDGVPVYNVARPILQKNDPNASFYLLEV
ncbi:MAG TPA: metallophosphoesterase, partial [Flavisolibacter sp.]|nr:metallophosphoesterase [Flavisolibacter sp.]